MKINLKLLYKKIQNTVPIDKNLFVPGNCNFHNLYHFLYMPEFTLNFRHSNQRVNVFSSDFSHCDIILIITQFIILIKYLFILLPYKISRPSSFFNEVIVATTLCSSIMLSAVTFLLAQTFVASHCCVLIDL